MKIIAGKFKGRNLMLSSVQKNNEQMRPTTSFAKSVLFNLLAQNAIVQTNLENKKVLDCFCGTGAVGFEFASHGAGEVMFIDSDETNISQIHKNAENLEINYTARVGFFPHAKVKEEFDIIFIDPPYIAAQSQTLKTIINLITHSLAKSGMMIIELSNNKHSSLKKNIYEVIAEKMDVILEREVSDKTLLLFVKFKNSTL
ncbi:MAG: RsmD family RNA methyltransferase [Proteobacteria bacterium]|nr:RsmD family RNA methyltransferase [Pseudomonadota bacterium]